MMIVKRSIRRLYTTCQPHCYQRQLRYVSLNVKETSPRCRASFVEQFADKSAKDL